MISMPVKNVVALVVSASLTLALAACTPAKDASDANPLVGAPAPKFNAEAIGGSGPKSIEEGKGKVLIVDFWGTFCGPCKKSFPKYQELADQFGGDVAILAVAVDQPDEDTPDGVKKTKGAIEKFVKDTNVKFSIVWDKDHSIVEKQYHVAKMPTSFILDKEGVVRFVHATYETGEDAKIAEEVKGLVSGK